MTADLWPLFNLRIKTPRLELRLPADDEIAKVADVVRATGVHDETIPFIVDWTNSSDPKFAQSIAQYHWSRRASWQPSEWHFETIAFLDGEPVGGQSLEASDFAILRQVSTGSWLLKSHQGLGLGKEMRAGVLEFGFTYLDALEAHSESRVGNGGSAGVSKSLGYEHNGFKRAAFGDQIDTEDRWRLTRDRWKAHRPDFKLDVEGFEDCRSMFGLD